jgi:hypothetical protein
LFLLCGGGKGGKRKLRMEGEENSVFIDSVMTLRLHVTMNQNIFGYFLNGKCFQ